MSYKEFDVNGIGKIKIYKRKNNRSLRLTVAANGAVRLTMPLWTPYQVGLAFTRAKSEWIKTQSVRRTNPIYADGMKIGKSHHLILKMVESNIPIKTAIRQTTVTVIYGKRYSPTDDAVQQAIHNACLRALRRQAVALLGQRLEQLSSIHDIIYAKLAIKQMKGRWGSCDQNKNIVLNLYLVQLPWELIDYVILHELTHTRVLRHGEPFWRELEKFSPNAKQLRKKIKLHRPELYVA